VLQCEVGGVGCVKSGGRKTPVVGGKEVLPLMVMNCVVLCVWVWKSFLKQLWKLLWQSATIPMCCIAVIWKWQNQQNMF